MDTGDWVVVSVAVLLAGTTLGVLLTLPVWTAAARPRWIPALLATHAGVVAVVGVITVRAATRSWELIDDPTAPASMLLDVSRIDGDGSMYALLVLAVAFGTTLSVIALSLAARFAAGDDPLERIVACAVLALELAVGGYGAARLLDGGRSVAALALAAHVPILVWAIVRCWPPPEPLPRR